MLHDDPITPFSCKEIVGALFHAMQAPAIDGLRHRPMHIVFTNSTEANGCARSCQAVQCSVSIASIAQGVQALITRYAKTLNESDAMPDNAYANGIARSSSVLG